MKGLLYFARKKSGLDGNGEADIETVYRLMSYVKGRLFQNIGYARQRQLDYIFCEID